MTATQYVPEKIYYQAPVVNGTVVTATWSSIPSGLTFAGERIVDGNPQAVVLGFTANKTFVVVCHCLMSDGQEIESRLTVVGRP